jgi:hypothetical protein
MIQRNFYRGKGADQIAISEQMYASEMRENSEERTCDKKKMKGKREGTKEQKHTSRMKMYVIILLLIQVKRLKEKNSNLNYSLHEV